VSVSSISDNTRFPVERSNANALESNQSTSLFNVNSPSSTADSSSVVKRETGELDQVFVAQPTITRKVYSRYPISN
jgi:hypothetical protein